MTYPDSNKTKSPNPLKLYLLLSNVTVYVLPKLPAERDKVNPCQAWMQNMNNTNLILFQALMRYKPTTFVKHSEFTQDVMLLSHVTDFY